MSRDRIVWLDAARGVCVVLVVATHFLYWGHAPDLDIENEAFWRKVARFGKSFRMPLLFAISGFIVADRIRAGWGDRRNLLRVASSYYLYIVWLSVFAVVSIFIPPGTTRRIKSVGSYFEQFVSPVSILWFILALTVYVAVLTTLKKVHPAIILMSLGFVSILISDQYTSSTMPEFQMRFVYYCFFFAIGVYLRPALEYFANSGAWWKLIIAGAIFMVLRQATSELPKTGLPKAVLKFVTESSAVFAGVAAVAVLCMIPLIAKALSAIGKRTLPIYVMHLPLMWFLIVLPFPAAVYESRAVAIAAPVVGPLLVIGLSLIIYNLMQRTPLRYMFDLPPKVKSLLLTKRLRRDVGTEPVAVEAPAVVEAPVQSELEEKISGPAEPELTKR